MKRIIPAILALAALMAMTQTALAEEDPKYSFASVQGAKDIKVVPGGEVAGSVYFYNISGNRITHINLEVAQAPPDWQVEIQPPKGETQVEVSGQVVTVTENLYIEPSVASPEEIKDVPDGMICIPVSTRGYALAKEARIIIKVPATEDIGTREEIVIAGTASWLGQGGAAALKQARDFKYTVEVVSETFEERIIHGGGIGRWWPAIAGAAAIIAAMAVFLLIRRRRGQGN